VNPHQRLASLDAFRGFAIAGMVLVNNPGDWNHLYSQLAHAKWDGWTFTDWIFPFFLFISGVSMTLSLGRRGTGADKPQLMAILARRAAVIFLVGLLLNLVPAFNLATVRIPGVLQRIALCTLLAAPIVLWCGWRAQAAWIAALLAIYSVLMLVVPVPDVNGIVAAGRLEPGRDFGAYIDRALLGGHLWSQSKTWDPEGLVSTLPAIGTLLFGVLTGHLLASRLAAVEKTVWMLLSGLALLWLGAVLDVLLMPINKSLWTPSYAIFMAGWALLVFGAFHWLMDAAPQAALRHAARRGFQPLVIYGMNALFIFALSGFVVKMLYFFKLTQADGSKLSLRGWMYQPFQALPLAPEQASLLWALSFNAAMFAVAWWMWRRRWFVKA
jgi:predicted acyltransferase